MLINERNNRKERVIAAANMMATAARTAPKGKGIDIIEIAIATDETIVEISQKLQQLGDATGMPFLFRDSENILQGDALLLISLCYQFNRFRYCHRFRLFCGHGPTYRYPRHVFGRLGSPTNGFIGRL